MKRNNNVVFIVFCIFICFIFFYKLHHWPAVYQYSEFDGLKYLIQFFINLEFQYFNPHWLWHDSYLHTSGESPLMWLTHSIPFLLMDYSFFTIRLGPVILAIFSILVTYKALNLLIHDQNNVVLILLSLVSSPAYLVLVRSSSIISIGISIHLLTISSIIFMMNKANFKNVLFSGILLVLLGYGHTTLRIFLPTLFIFISYILFIQNKRLFVFFLCFILILLMPLS